MERTITNKLTCKFSGLYPKSWEEDALPPSHAPGVFRTNHCNFPSFQAAIKSLPFDLRA